MMGELTFFLGLQITQRKDGIFINQAKYTNELLKKSKMNGCNALDTLMASTTKLDKDEKGTCHFLGECLISCLIYSKLVLLLPRLKQNM